MKEKGITNIGTPHIHPHPENPRKDLGDLSELAESLKKNGVMQNLTVVPIPEQEGEYYALIGNRRHGAALIAEIAELPCRIVEDLSQREQLSIMLEENIQRNDLTIWEQAQGFQMMLDLGETEESISEKTGFSKTTVRHRLNIAKLDQKLLKQAEQSDSFQLTLSDLYALEQVEDIKTRNKILKEASSSRDLIWKAKSAAEEAKRDKNEKQIVEMLKDIGLEAAPNKVKDTLYSGNWETMESFDLDKAVPKRISKKKVEGGMYVRSYRELKVVRKRDKSKEPQTEWEKKLKQKEKNAKTIKAIAKEMAAQRESFVRNIITGKIEPLKNTDRVVDNLWKAIVYGSGSVGKIDLLKFLAGTKKNWYEVPEEDKKKAMDDLGNLSTLHQLMIGAFNATKELVFTDYDNHYKPEIGKAVIAITEALNEYGFSYAEDEQNKVMEGSHECYEKVAKNEKSE